jgi:hypothetical protein
MASGKLPNAVFAGYDHDVAETWVQGTVAMLATAPCGIPVTVRTTGIGSIVTEVGAMLSV